MTKRPSQESRPAKESPPDLDPQLLRRVVVEAIEPQIDGGRFPIKRTVGEQVRVRADVFADGHDAVSAVVRYRRAGDERWREMPMASIGNDRWQAAFTVTSLGCYEYTVDAWIDRFASWRHELSKKVGAAQDVSSELLEGAALIAGAIGRRPVGASDGHVLETLRTLESGDDNGRRVAAALSEELAAFMAARPDRSQATSFDRVLDVKVDRERARFGAWYEMFPRSAGSDPSRSASFAEAAARLPYVASMGFDVLYLPPIHPIGRTFRKGPNNSLTSTPTDPGSPWAIGSDEGGHTSIEPGLGTIEDFD